MINTGFIHQYDELDKINTDYMETKNEIDSIYEPILFLTEKVKYEIFFNESIDETVIMLEDVKKDFFEKIGDTIINIIKRCRDFIDDKIRSFKEFSWNRKSILDKKETILKKSPNLSERVKTSLDANLIDLNSLKDFKDFSENYEKMLDELDRADDETSFKEKWNKITRKVSESSQTIIKIGQVAGAVVTVAGLLTIGKKIRADLEKVDVNQMGDQAKLRHGEMTRKIHTLSKMNDRKDGLEVPHWKGYMAAQMAADDERITKGYISKITSDKMKITGLIDKAYSRCIPNKIVDAHSTKIMNDAKTKYVNIAKVSKKTEQELNDYRRSLRKPIK